MVGIPAVLMAVSALVYQRYYYLHEGFNKEDAEKATQVKGTPVEA